MQDIDKGEGHSNAGQGGGGANCRAVQHKHTPAEQMGKFYVAKHGGDAVLSWGAVAQWLCAVPV